MDKLWNADDWSQFNEHQAYALVLAMRNGLTSEPGLHGKIRDLLRKAAEDETADWASKYPLGDDTRFGEVLKDLVAYYQGAGMLVVSNHDLDAETTPPQDAGTTPAQVAGTAPAQDARTTPAQTVRQALLSAYPGRIKTIEELVGGSVRPGRGDEAGFMGYTAMLQSDGPEGMVAIHGPARGDQVGDAGRQVRGPQLVEIRRVLLQVEQGAPGRPDDGGAGRRRGQHGRAGRRQDGFAGDAGARALAAVPGDAEAPRRQDAGGVRGRDRVPVRPADARRPGPPHSQAPAADSGTCTVSWI